jgi:Domain of unknown function (DUF892)
MPAKKILTALPKMAKAAQSPDLKAPFEKHDRETEGHVERLEKVFGLLDQSPKGTKCELIEGLVKEGQRASRSSKIRRLSMLRCWRLRSRSSLEGILLSWPLSGFAPFVEGALSGRTMSS